MAAAVETMMFAGDTPWHGLGKYIGQDDILSAEAVTQAGLDWEVEKRQLFYQVGERSMEAQNHRAIVRVKDNKCFGVVGKSYEPVQNSEAFDFLDSLVEEGQIKYHTAGALNGGSRVWILAQLGSPIFVTPEDKVERFLLLSNPHDGSGSLLVLPTGIRVVCANTLALAHRRGKSKGLRFRHTRHVKVRMAQAAEIIKASNDAFEDYEVKAKKLAAHDMDSAEWKAFAKHLFESAKDGATQRSVSIVRNKRDKLEDLFNNGRGQDLEGVKGTAWAALNAATEYKDYFRSTSGGQEGRLKSAWLGAGDRFGDQAFTWLQGLVTGDPEVQEQVQEQHVHVQGY